MLNVAVKPSVQICEAFEVRLDWVRSAFEMRLKRLRCVWIGFEVRLRSVRGAFGLSFEVRLRCVCHGFAQHAQRSFEAKRSDLRSVRGAFGLGSK